MVRPRKQFGGKVHRRGSRSGKEELRERSGGGGGEGRTIGLVPGDGGITHSPQHNLRRQKSQLAETRRL